MKKLLRHRLFFVTLSLKSSKSRFSCEQCCLCTVLFECSKKRKKWKIFNACQKFTCGISGIARNCMLVNMQHVPRFEELKEWQKWRTNQFPYIVKHTLILVFSELLAGQNSHQVYREVFSSLAKSLICLHQWWLKPWPARPFGVAREAFFFWNKT